MLDNVAEYATLIKRITIDETWGYIYGIETVQRSSE